MGSLFSTSGTKGRKKDFKKRSDDDEVITAKDKAVLDLKNARDKLKKFRKKVLFYCLSTKRPSMVSTIPFS
jgi:hypothetical protein